MSNDIEKRLLKKAKSGDMNAFESLIINYEKSIYNMVYRMVLNEEDAKDVTQEVFIKMYKSLDRFEEQSSFYTWLYRIAHNTSIDFIRKRKIETVSLDADIEIGDGKVSREIKDSGATPEEAYITLEANSEIEMAISLLPEEQRQLIVLRDLQELSYAEISEITNTTLGTVKSRISRARAALKNIFLSVQEQKAFKGVKEYRDKGGRR